MHMISLNDIAAVDTTILTTLCSGGLGLLRYRRRWRCHSRGGYNRRFVYIGGGELCIAREACLAHVVTRTHMLQDYLTCLTRVMANVTPVCKIQVTTFVWSRFEYRRTSDRFPQIIRHFTSEVWEYSIELQTFFTFFNAFQIGCVQAEGLIYRLNFKKLREVRKGVNTTQRK